jgi:pyruvate/2-oxoglutarate/acetoin dehydrogenase E1 component/TPP-dependent pyruvate/acetoin dehydrogenase alpha subunit
VVADPASAGRQMNGHFATRMLDEDGELKDLAHRKNSSADISPTAGQMSRLLGLAWASKLFREEETLKEFQDLSTNGNEVAFGTIGNASTSEGVFFETINAAGVLQVPMVLSVWDDGYGISVPQEYHTTKQSISKILAGFQRTKKEKGFEILVVKGWDYPELIKTYEKAVAIARKEHVPVLIHVTELTQPQGHSTSGSHERYKTKERLVWERAHDCNVKMREWILENDLIDEAGLLDIEKEGKEEAKQARNIAWKKYLGEIVQEKNELLELIDITFNESEKKAVFNRLKNELAGEINPIKADLFKTIKQALRATRDEDIASRAIWKEHLIRLQQKAADDYSSHLNSESPRAAIHVKSVAPKFDPEPEIVDGREVLQACFDAALSRDSRVLAFGEDLGKIGDVNQAFAGLQQKYGALRVSDTGIRENTIIGQGIGTALRGLRPIAEIQYLDYLLYALQVLSDDLSTLHYRTKGGQKAPLIVRTRGHRLEGIWHSGSPMGMILNALRGMYVLVPRNMIKAAAFYNTLLSSDDPALVIECLNGYRLKEQLPANIGEIREELGVPEIIREGDDLTIVTYGSMCRIALAAAEQLEEIGISVEVIDVQTLLPFDKNGMILESIKKTNRVVFADEDVPGGATAYMMQEVLEKHDAYRYLDSKPTTLTAKAHRAAYGSDGDYFSKPNVEDVFDAIYEIIAEVEPSRFPDLY